MGKWAGEVRPTLSFCSARVSRSSLQTVSVRSVVCRVLYCKGGMDDPLLSLSAELEDEQDTLRSFLLWNKFFIYCRVPPFPGAPSYSGVRTWVEGSQTCGFRALAEASSLT